MTDLATLHLTSYDCCNQFVRKQYTFGLFLTEEGEFFFTWVSNVSGSSIYSYHFISYGITETTPPKKDQSARIKARFYRFSSMMKLSSPTIIFLVLGLLFASMTTTSPRETPAEGVGERG
ncbi:unnamed protein product [Musa banksii]